MMQNKGTFTTGCRYDKDPSGTKVHNKPNCNMTYIHNMIASQKGEKPSRTVTEAEEESMFNQIWNQDYREKR
jgi:hypothetical protein